MLGAGRHSAPAERAAIIREIRLQSFILAEIGIRAIRVIRGSYELQKVELHILNPLLARERCSSTCCSDTTMKNRSVCVTSVFYSVNAKTQIGCSVKLSTL